MMAMLRGEMSLLKTLTMAAVTPSCSSKKRNRSSITKDSPRRATALCAAIHGTITFRERRIRDEKENAEEEAVEEEGMKDSTERIQSKREEKEGVEH